MLTYDKCTCTAHAKTVTAAEDSWEERNSILLCKLYQCFTKSYSLDFLVYVLTSWDVKNNLFVFLLLKNNQILYLVNPWA